MEWRKPMAEAKPRPQQRYHVKVYVAGAYEYYVDATDKQRALAIAAYRATLDAQSNKDLQVIPTLVED